MSASEARLAAFRLAANAESSELSKQLQAAQTSQSEVARHYQELQHQLEALRVALACSQQDRAAMVSRDTPPRHHHLDPDLCFVCQHEQLRFLMMIPHTSSQEAKHFVEVCDHVHIW